MAIGEDEDDEDYATGRAGITHMLTLCRQTIAQQSSKLCPFTLQHPWPGRQPPLVQLSPPPPAPAPSLVGGGFSVL